MTLAAGLIKGTRTAAGLSQAELARRAGTSQPTIAAYESGTKVPTAGTLERVLGAMGTGLSAGRPTSRPRAAGLRRLLLERRQQILDIAAKHHAANVRVFGSLARGEETPRSDIDLLVDMDHEGSLLDQVRLRRALSELLEVEVDLVTSGGLREADRATIGREAVPI